MTTKQKMIEQRQGADGVVRFAHAGSATVTAGERTVSFVFSDGTVDRYGDTIDARGWDLTAFNANPVALFGHDAGTVANVIGKAKNVRVAGGQLVGDIEFASAEVNPNAETVYQMVKGGWLNTVSVGFMPREFVASKARPGGIDFKKQELMEISVVPVPANPNAVALARAAGIDVDRLGLLAAAKTRDMAVTKKGMYSVAELARLLENLGWLADCAEWEAEYEGDNSEVPGKLHDALMLLGQTLIDMTIEEVGELLGMEGDEGEAVQMAANETLTKAQKFVLAVAGRKPAPVAKYLLTTSEHLPQSAVQSIVRQLDSFLASDTQRSAVLPAGMSVLALDDVPAVTKAGKTISAANTNTINEACGHIMKGHGMLAAMVAPPDDGDDKEPDNDPDDAVTKAAAEAAEIANALATRTRKARALKIKANMAS